MLIGRKRIRKNEQYRNNLKKEASGLQKWSTTVPLPETLQKSRNEKTKLHKMEKVAVLKKK